MEISQLVQEISYTQDTCHAVTNAKLMQMQTLMRSGQKKEGHMAMDRSPELKIACESDGVMA